MTCSEYLNGLSGKRIAVVGIGVSNTPLIRLLVKYNAAVTACDKKDSLGVPLENELKSLGVELNLGAGYLDAFDHDIIFRSPGIRDDIPQFKEAEKKGSIVTSEMEVFFDLCPAKIFAVTGSDGKTTTTTLIHELLKTEGYKVRLGGNIGKPLLPEIEEITEDEMIVLELSSFQLQSMRKSADVAVITNLAPNHLDWHTGMEEYVEAKKNIYKYQNEAQKLITNADNEITSKITSGASGKTMMFSRERTDTDIYSDGSAIYVSGERVVDTDKILLPGVHNVENYMAAAGAVYEYVSADTIRKVASTFSKIPHRIEFTRELGGVKYYNDSIASSPSRAIAGLNSFDRRVIMLAGGYDKKIPFDVLGPVISDKVKKLILMGKTADKIEAAVKSAENYNPSLTEILHVSSLEEAVKTAHGIAAEGDIVILCPACASFDMFKNFEERGNMFKELVNNL